MIDGNSNSENQMRFNVDEMVECDYEGKGELRYRNGAIYIGDFKNGLREGKGKIIQQMKAMTENIKMI